MHHVCSEEDSLKHDHDPQAAEPRGDADEPGGIGQVDARVTLLPDFVVRIPGLGQCLGGPDQVEGADGDANLLADKQARYQEQEDKAGKQNREGHVDSNVKCRQAAGWEKEHVSD